MYSSEMIAVLLSWAVNLSGYPLPQELPTVEYKPRIFFVQHACNNNSKCSVAAWYNNNGVIFLSDELKNLSDPIIRSVFVHELVHYLLVAKGIKKQIINQDFTYS